MSTIPPRHLSNSVSAIRGREYRARKKRLRGLAVQGEQAVQNTISNDPSYAASLVTMFYTPTGSDYPKVMNIPRAELSRILSVNRDLWEADFPAWRKCRGV